jgi:hypothetical protein
LRAWMVSFAIRATPSSVQFREARVGPSGFNLRSSASGESRNLPRDTITPRAMKFSSSRIFLYPSDAVSPFITPAGMPSILFCICFTHFWTK